MTYFQAYLLTRLDAFGNLFRAGILIGILVCFISLCISMEKCKWEKNLTLKGMLIFALFALLKTLTPTTKEAAFIYIAPAIVNNQDVQKTIKKIPELSGLGLEYLGEVLKEKAKEEIKQQIKE